MRNITLDSTVAFPLSAPRGTFNLTVPNNVTLLGWSLFAQAATLTPGANALDTVNRVRSEMAQVSKSFPAGVSYDIPYDTTRFIEVSIQEVVKTLAEAMVLVILVVYLFLQTWRATLIPAVAVPVSLIGAFIGPMLGFYGFYG